MSCTQPSTAPSPQPYTYLFVPGNRADRLDSAWRSAADDVVVDLEDAVALSAKAEARHTVAKWLKPSQPVWLRVNAQDTPWFADDLRLACQPGVKGVMLPKAESLSDSLLAACAAHGLLLLPLVETALGLHRALDLGRSPHVKRLAFGSIDFQVDLGIEGDDQELLFFRSQLVWASRLAGLPAPVDGVTADFADDARVQQDSLRARRLGFGGKLCIHPRQLAPVSTAFAPDAAQQAWAARVLAATEAAQGQAVAVDGKMVDRPVWLQAQRWAASREPLAAERLHASLDATR